MGRRTRLAESWWLAQILSVCSRLMSTRYAPVCVSGCVSGRVRVRERVRACVSARVRVCQDLACVPHQTEARTHSREQQAALDAREGTQTSPAQHGAGALILSRVLCRCLTSLPSRRGASLALIELMQHSTTGQGRGKAPQKQLLALACFTAEAAACSAGRKALASLAAAKRSLMRP